MDKIYIKSIITIDSFDLEVKSDRNRITTNLTPCGIKTIGYEVRMAKE